MLPNRTLHAGGGRALVAIADTSHERIRFATDAVLLGEFHCAAGDPAFSTAGQIRNHVVAFPRGAVWIARERERPFVADPGVATVYTPGQPYTRRAISHDGDRSDWFAVSESLAREIVSLFSRSDAEGDFAFRHSRATVTDELYFAQRRLFEQLARPRADRAEIEERAIGLVTAVVRSAYRGGVRAPDPFRTRHSRVRRELSETAKEVIASTLVENLSVSDIAARLDVSVFHLCRTFREVTGLTLHEYRRAIRLRVALGLTRAYRGKLSALALDMGFYSHSHFTAAFRKAFGASPSDGDPLTCPISETSGRTENP